jgi:hypothetical protein
MVMAFPLTRAPGLPRGFLASLLTLALASFFPGAAVVSAAGLPSRHLDPDPAFSLPAVPYEPGTQVGSLSLVENARAWDGLVISFTGEAIGEMMRRGNMAWIHLNDDAYMWKNIEEGAELGGYNSGQAVWVSAAEAKKIAFFGDYKHEGDVVAVTGAVHAACPEHGGDMDIHATALQIVRTGHPVDHVMNRRRVIIAVLLVIIVLVLQGFKKMAESRRV